MARNLLMTAAAVMAVALGSVSAHASTFTVDATAPIGAWLDTGIDLQAGATYESIVLDPSTQWSAGSDSPYSRSSTADGIDPIASGYGQFSDGGLTANYGALVGEVGGTYFLLGTGPTTFSGLSGELYIGYWDSYYGDNSGTQTVSIAAVPEPATWAMMLAGFGLIGFALRRRILNTTYA
jgi:hypothetical protein